MSAAKLNRKLHRMGALLVFLPLIVVIGSGLLLQVRKELEWVQPSEVAGTGGPPTLRLEAALESARSAGVGINSWSDVDRMEVRPESGIIKVRGKNLYEVQVDASSGVVLKASLRRSDLIESIHDGSWFSDGARKYIFLPAAVILLGLWFTGVYLWLMPHLIRRRKRQNMFA